MNSLELLTMTSPQMMLDTMDDTTYAFYLAYGMSPEEEELESLLDVKMYNTMYTSDVRSLEACNSSVLFRDASEAKATRVEF